MRRKLYAVLLSTALVLGMAGCGKSSPESSQEARSSGQTAQEKTDTAYKYERYSNMTAAEIAAELTLEQKAAQMVQPACYMVTEEQMLEADYGSVLSKYSTVGYKEWQEIVDGFQENAVKSEAGIPMIYGQDDVHGVGYCADAVYFPQNIGMGAANDPELMYQVGLMTADEAKLCHMLWNFAPCLAQSADPRWGRTYESYGSDLEMIKSLGTAYTKGLQDGGVVACAKHFFGDGNAVYGTGEDSDVDRLIDRGDAQLSDDEIKALLSVYQAEIDAGVQTVMISHTALNGVKMHENAEYIQKLKNEMGFKGFIVSDWNSIQNTSLSSYYLQVVTAVNAGIDMLMEVSDYDRARECIVDGVNKGDITEERVNDAVTRILQVKLDEGIIADPFCKSMKTVQSETGSAAYRQVAEQLVEESLVLLKNEGQVLPLKKGSKVYITGPAADHAQAQCGGWTIDWNRSPDISISGVTTILAGFQAKAAEYGIEVITDPARASEADTVLLVVGEEAYAEWNGDTEDLQLCGSLGLRGNEDAIREAKDLGKQVVACIVAGRQVIINDYYSDWDSVVMCYLPGSEGQGVADVLCGGSNFRGKLPSPWYSSVDQIGTGNAWLEKGYGLEY